MEQYYYYSLAHANEVFSPLSWHIFQDVHCHYVNLSELLNIQTLHIRSRHLNVLLSINIYNGPKFCLSILENSALMFFYVLISHSADRIIQFRSIQLVIYLLKHLFNKSRDSAVGITTGCGLDYPRVGVRVPVGSRTFTFPCHSDRLWDPPSLLSNGYQGHFPLG
jgi:hypothetical protein